MTTPIGKKIIFARNCVSNPGATSNAAVRWGKYAATFHRGELRQRVRQEIREVLTTDEHIRTGRMF